MTLTSTEPRELDPKFNVNTDNVRQTRSIFCTLARMDQWKNLVFQMSSRCGCNKLGLLCAMERVDLSMIDPQYIMFRENYFMEN